MGYYTQFNLQAFDMTHFARCEKQTPQYFEVSKDLERKIAFEINTVFLDAIDETFLKDADSPFEMLFEESMKWYSWEEDMRDLSLAFPHVLFKLTGEGEEREDVWEAIIYRGKVKKAKAILVYPNLSIDDVIY